MNEQGDMASGPDLLRRGAAARPGFAKARYNRANAQLDLGDPDGRAGRLRPGAWPMAEPTAEAAMMRLARSTMLLAAGRVGEGWDAYEARLDPLISPTPPTSLIDRPRWTPDSDLAGKSLLVFGEQGLGDEVLFANSCRT